MSTPLPELRPRCWDSGYCGLSSWWEYWSRPDWGCGSSAAAETKRRWDRWCFNIIILLRSCLDGLRQSAIYGLDQHLIWTYTCCWFCHGAHVLWGGVLQHTVVYHPAVIPRTISVNKYDVVYIIYMHESTPTLCTSRSGLFYVVFPHFLLIDFVVVLQKKKQNNRHWCGRVLPYHTRYYKGIILSMHSC